MDIQIESKWVKDRSEFPDDRVSYSVLKELESSFAEALYKKNFPSAPTPAMEFGKAVDAMLLNTNAFGELVVVHPTTKSKLTKEFKEAKAAQLAEDPDVVYLDQTTMLSVEECINAVYSTGLWNDHMSGDVRHNVAGVLAEPIHEGEKLVGVQHVANIIDCINVKGDEIIGLHDLKVVNDVTGHAFRNQVDRMRWDIQAAAYVRMVEMITGYRPPFAWFCVKNAPPWTVARWRMDEAWLNAAEIQLVEWISEWFYWKNEPILGEALVVRQEDDTLYQPPWRQ